MQARERGELGEGISRGICAKGRIKDPFCATFKKEERSSRD